MKKGLISLVTALSAIYRAILPEKCPKCNQKLHTDGQKGFRASISTICMNPECDWLKKSKPQPINRS